MIVGELLNLPYRIMLNQCALQSEIHVYVKETCANNTHIQITFIISNHILRNKNTNTKINNNNQLNERHLLCGLPSPFHLCGVCVSVCLCACVPVCLSACVSVSVVHERIQKNAFIEHVHFYENDELNAT